MWVSLFISVTAYLIYSDPSNFAIRYRASLKKICDVIVSTLLTLASIYLFIIVYFKFRGIGLVKFLVSKANLYSKPLLAALIVRMVVSSIGGFLWIIKGFLCIIKGLLCSIKSLAYWLLFNLINLFFFIVKKIF
jgi:hypothetical protein